MATNYSTSQTIGPNLDIETSDARFPLGTVVTGPKNQRWVYCQAAAALTAYKFVGINSAYSAAVLSTSTVSTTITVGVPQRAFTSAYYGWFCVNGSGVYGLIDGTTDINPGSDLAVSGVAAGLLADYSVSTQYLVAGILAVTTCSNATDTAEVVMNSPHIILSRA